ncbi:ABC transporter substrate-binding protein [Hahella aquimaris]|uniref:ABC transporter substrate-binding protein n=1 Tax=Hahella sp. HNIBRBA332 TaxID=3015983 RepID=UPI00273C9FA5|nr:ABC transporter substrate-binding protein [Hahella sp. HNIBRBA332]WLQ14503.1 ABC transporter substrate-binding protein [Hahella sp. HNIBRBA332]
MVKRSFISVLALLAAAFSVLSHAKPTYVDYKPISDVVKLNVGEVNTRSLSAPVITWGGDIATLLANGNQTQTAKGSIFDKKGLQLKLYREDAFVNQVKSYVAGETPFLRGTVGMISAAAELLNKDPRTQPVVIYQLTWSSGGDALVVKSNIRNAKDLKGKTIAIQAYGPHVDYAARILKDAGLSFKDVNVRWLPDLTGTNNAPMAAFYEQDVDAAFVIIPDALALTSGGNVGSGSEDSVKGARILLSTRTADKVIADVYAVRKDYFDAHRSEVEAFVAGLLEGEEALGKLFQNKTKDVKPYRDILAAAGKLLLDSEEATADVEGLFADATFVGLQGNKQFFTDSNYPRRFDALSSEVQTGLQQAGILSKPAALTKAAFDYGFLGAAVNVKAEAAKPRFDEEKVAQLVNQRQQQQSLAEGELFSFEVFFQPNQKSFSIDLYQDSFDKVVELASTYGGAIITVEGNSDPMEYLRAKKKGEQAVVLGRIKQSARNLSLARAQEVRDNIIQYAAGKNISLDPSQFAVVGNGIANPKTGICGAEPCAPKNQQEWRSNMRVEFRIIQVEAESDVFMPL